jgi:hypothetical protein
LTELTDEQAIFLCTRLQKRECINEEVSRSNRPIGCFYAPARQKLVKGGGDGTFLNLGGSILKKTRCITSWDAVDFT